jgi:hypothetical protein
MRAILAIAIALCAPAALFAKLGDTVEQLKGQHKSTPLVEGATLNNLPGVTRIVWQEGDQLIGALILDGKSVYEAVTISSDTQLKAAGDKLHEDYADKSWTQPEESSDGSLILVATDGSMAMRIGPENVAGKPGISVAVMSAAWRKYSESRKTLSL